MTKIIFTVLLFSCFGILYAQTERTLIENTGFLPTGKGVTDGSVTIISNHKLHSLIKKHIEINNDNFPGWRVQIYFGSGKSAMGKAKAIKRQFLNKYGHEHGAYIKLEAPYFKVRVGDFRTKSEALKFKHDISRMFSSSWVVPDIVNYPDKSKE